MKAEQKLAALTTLARNFGGEAWEFTRASIHSNGYITGRGGRTIVQTSGGDVPANVCRYIQQADPETMLVIAEAFDQMKQRAEAAEAIVADVEEIIGLLAEREWAEHCTKTDIGKRLEEAITELHNEAAPDVVDNQKAVGKFVFEPMGERWHHIKHGEAQHAEPKLPMVPLFTHPAAPQPAPPVFGYMRVVSGQSFQIMEGTQRPPDRSGNGAGPWFAIYRQPPAPAIKLADLAPDFHVRPISTDQGPAWIECGADYPRGRHFFTRAAILRNIEESKQ